jgi:uncharacterized protein (TIGR03067 family)
MSRRYLVLLVWCVSLTYAWSGDADERKKLEGTWRFVGPSAKDGSKDDQRAAMRVVFRGDSIAFVAEGKKAKAQGAYQIDPSKNPKTMDITVDTNGKNSTTLAIYELSGDTLKLCHFLGASSSKERPQEFAADKKTVLGILKREK